MTKSVLALAAAAAIVLASAAASTPVQAGKSGRALTTGIAIGLGAAIVGGAIANSRPAYAYPRTYYPVAEYQPYPTYYVRAPYGCPGGYWARKPYYNQFGQVVGWSKPRFFCPY